MEKRIKLLFSFFAVFSVTLLISDIVIKEVVKPFEESLVQNNEEVTKDDDYLYKISVFNGKIAVFDRNSKIPYKVYDTYVDSLPTDEKNMIAEGIKVYSSSELMKIIEEFTS